MLVDFVLGLFFEAAALFVAGFVQLVGWGVEGAVEVEGDLMVGDGRYWGG